MQPTDDAAAQHAPERAPGAADIPALDALVVSCRACPRLVAWREEVGRVKRTAYRDQTYWARPVPGFGDPSAAIVVVGLAPGAHGANRTGRMFTGDRSGDVLFGALHRAGLASGPTSAHRGDGLRLRGVRLTAPVRCAPPGNAPTPQERRTCAPFVAREIELVQPVVLLALGAVGWHACLASAAELGWAVPRPRPRFAHGSEVVLAGAPGARPLPSLTLLGCYHVSQQNTFTGRLTAQMIDAVLHRAKALAGL